jgi:hypothetical protein
MSISLHENDAPTQYKAVHPRPGCSPKILKIANQHGEPAWQ